MDVRVNLLLVGSYVGANIAAIGGFLLMPELFFNYPHRGLSFYGNYMPTVIPFAVGILISIICMVAAALSMPTGRGRLGIMRRLLLALAFGLLIVLVTPEQKSLAFYWAHTLAAVYVFMAGGIGSLWIMTHAGRTKFDWFLLSLAMAGCAITLLSASYMRVFGVLALGQVLALNGGLLLIARAASRWFAEDTRLAYIVSRAVTRRE